MERDWSATVRAPGSFNSITSSASASSFGGISRPRERELHSKRSRRPHHLGHVRIRSILRIDEYGGRGGLGYQIAEQFEPLAPHRGGGEHGHPSEIATGPVEARDKAVRLYFSAWDLEAMGDSDRREPR